MKEERDIKAKRNTKLKRHAGKILDQINVHAHYSTYIQCVLPSHKYMNILSKIPSYHKRDITNNIKYI